MFEQYLSKRSMFYEISDSYDGGLGISLSEVLPSHLGTNRRYAICKKTHFVHSLITFALAALLAE
jgi:hypothetical protein